MYKIGDFSKLGQVSARMLRHYDKLGLLTPSQTDKWTGYRYYTIDQLSDLHRIIALKDMGLSLEQITQLLCTGETISITQLRGMLRMRQANLAQELQDKQNQLSRVEARLRQLEQENEPSRYEVVVKSLPPQPIASLRTRVPTVDEMAYYCRTLYMQLYTALQQQQVQPLSPEITLYHNDEFTETDLDTEIAVAVQAQHIQQPPSASNLAFYELPAVESAASLIYEGAFANLEEGVLALLKYVGLHQHMIIGPLRELHLSGPAHPDGKAVVETAVIELQIPIQLAAV